MSIIKCNIIEDVTIAYYHHPAILNRLTPIILKWSLSCHPKGGTFPVNLKGPLSCHA